MSLIRTDGSLDRDSDADRWIKRWSAGLAVVDDEDPPPRVVVVVMLLMFLLCVAECDRYDGVDGGCGMFSSSANAPKWEEEVATAGSRWLAVKQNVCIRF